MQAIGSWTAALTKLVAAMYINPEAPSEDVVVETLTVLDQHPIKWELTLQLAKQFSARELYDGDQVERLARSMALRALLRARKHREILTMFPSSDTNTLVEFSARAQSLSHTGQWLQALEGFSSMSDKLKASASRVEGQEEVLVAETYAVIATNVLRRVGSQTTAHLMKHLPLCGDGELQLQRDFFFCVSS